ncbi:MAG: MerR family transcriptional regulator [Pseudomonadales bacterium]|nr:MerR family transcriptional regulator [Pseudomonadales bacterium]
MQDSKKYELDELLSEANRLRADDPELANTTPFNARTVYYYVQEGLLPGRSGTRGPGTRYSEQFLYRLLVIRRLQKETTLKLSDIRQVMDGIAADTLKAVALGQEPISVRGVPTREMARRVARERDETTMLLRQPRSIIREQGTPGAFSAADSFSMEDASAVPYSPSDEPDPEQMTLATTSAAARVKNSTSVKHTFPLADNAELVIRQNLSGKQMRQLENIAQLLADILQEE